MNDIQIRKPTSSDAEMMTEIARRSKGYWGYSEALLTAWKRDLTVTPDFVKKGIGCVLERDGTMIGYWIRAPIQSDEITNGFFFIEPQYIGHGYGRLLFNALREELLKNGIHSFVFEADPNAAGFYLKIGGKKIGEKESTMVPGRYFPIMKIEL